MTTTAPATVPYDAVLDELEAEAIHIYRETAAAFKNPVLLYSIGKDSSVLLHLAIKAFAPAPIPFPVMHIDTGWKFQEMITFRDLRAAELGLDLRIARTTFVNFGQARSEAFALAYGTGRLKYDRELFLTEATIKSHVARILTKLDLRDRLQILVYAYEHGLVRPGR